jgi:hypothetical protein
MVMTTLEARRTLTALERLLAALEPRSSGFDGDQLRLLQRLRHRRRSLRGLLAAREAERAKKIIDLGVWRDGALPPAGLESQLSRSML